MPTHFINARSFLINNEIHVLYACAIDFVLKETP